MGTKTSISTESILVIGGNGKTGIRVVARLSKLNLAVRAVSRSTTPKFDWEDESTWAACLKSAKSVYITYQPDLAIPSAVPAITRFTSMAAQAGITKMVLLSGRGEHEAVACEEIVKNAGTDWTIVRASWFNQNFSEGTFFDSIKAGLVALPVGDVLEPFIDADDIADVVVAALTQPGHSKKLYEVTGPRLLTFEDAVNEISKASQRDIQYQQVPVAEYSASLASYGLPPDFISLISYLFTEVLDGRNASVTNGVYQALGRPAKDFSRFAGEAAKTGVWNNHP